jgi:hypothetical protein
MIGTQWLGSISVGGLLMLGQVIENLDGISTIVQDGGRFGLIFAAMFVAYRLISKAQNDAAVIRNESFEDSTLSAKTTIEYLNQSLTLAQKQLNESREQLAADSLYYKNMLSELRAENEKMRAELELCRREIAALRLELAGFHGIEGR